MPKAAHPDQTAAARLPLTRDRVLRTAMSLADAGGIESLSMRKLGHALGVEAMSLYNHVANKEDILEGIVDVVVSEIELPSAAEDWQVAIRRAAISAHDALRRHPWACGLMMSPTGVRAARLRHIDSLLRRLREAGFSAETTYHAYHALDSHILGYTLWEAGHLAGPPDRPGLDAATVLREMPVDEYPHFAEHVEAHRAAGYDEDRAFELGLDLILDGLQRLAPPQP
ncbi:MAG: TetR/AcrR family transcriptional regulator C-terminal domain-containing protein [Solirubrobacteraceae bacterium]|jgi:AcrR family transcriptional regulator